MPIEPVEIDFLLKNLNFQAEAERMKAGIKGITATARQEADSTSAILTNMARGVGVFFSASYIKSFVGDIATVRGEFQQLEIGLKTILKSKSEADTLMQQIVQFASTTPFELKDVAQGAKQLLAYGFASKDVISNMKMLGDVSAGLSIPIGDLIYLYGTLNTQGRAYTRDILQFTSRGIPIVAELAKQFGVTKEEISGMVEAGQVGFPAIEKAFKSLTSEGGTFYNTIDDVSGSIPVMLSNLSDAFDKELNSIGKANEDLLVGSIAAATSIVSSLDSILDVVKTLVVAYGTYKAATMLVAVADGYAAAAKATNATSTLLLVGRTNQLTFAQYASARAQGVLNAVMAANPYVLAATALATLVTALYVFGDSTDEAAEAQARIEAKVSETQSKIEALVTVINSEKTATIDKTNALKELNGIMSSTVGHLDAKTLATQKGKDAVDAYIASLRRQAQLEELTNKIADNQQEQQRVSGGGNPANNFVSRVAFAGLSPDEQQADRSRAIYDLKEQEKELKKQIESLFEQKKTQDEITSAKKRTLEVIKAEIEEQKKLQEGAANRQEYDAFQKTIDKLEVEKTAIDGSKKKVKEKTGEYDRLNKAIEEAKDAVLNASEAERPKLQQKLADLVAQRRAYEDIIKAQRGETTDLKPIKLISPEIETGASTTTLELDKLNKKVDETGKKAVELKEKYKGALDPNKIDEINERWRRQQDIIGQSADFLAEMVDLYGEQIGLSEDQNKVLSAGMNTMKGMAQIASGNVIGGSLTILASAAAAMLKTPEKLSESFENVNKNIQKVIGSLETAEKTFSNLGQSSSVQSIRIVKAELENIAETAKSLNDELSKSSTGRRRDVNMSLPNIVKQAVDINIEIEKLTNRLLQGDISDDQRKAIEAVLDSYNSLLAQIDSVIQDITGTTVADLSQSLSDAVIDGAGAWDIWEQKAKDVIANVIGKQLQAKFLTAPITDAVNALVNNSGDGLTADEAKQFQDAIRSIYENVVPAYDAAINTLKQSGIDISSAASSSAKTGIAAGATEDTVAAMVGQMMAVRVDIKELLKIAAANQDDVVKYIDYLKQIAENTAPISRLKAIEEGISEMNRTLKDKL